jgi:hypothetical protein
MNKADYAYYEWLVSQVDIPGDRTYHDLFERMHNFEFVWFVPNDDNRVQDGLDLRIEFLNGNRPNLHLEGATMLEILVSLSRRVAFTGGGNERQWAWKLLKNLRLTKMSDPLTEEQAKRVDDILETLVYRTYERSGRGGFFPLKDSLEDQTKIELWYQMNAYVIEKDKNL